MHIWLRWSEVLIRAFELAFYAFMVLLCKRDKEMFYSSSHPFITGKCNPINDLFLGLEL